MVINCVQKVKTLKTHRRIKVQKREELNCSSL